MRYAKIREMDIANGDGVGVSLFVQGCTHHCKGCFNTETWDFNGGKDWNDSIQNQFLELCSKPYIDHISILGGEPLDQDEQLYSLLKEVKIYNKPIYLWSGYTWDEIQSMPLPKKIIDECVDVLIDGEFVEELADSRLKLRGSSNQSIIYKK